MKLIESAIKSINTIKFYENYMHSSGRMSRDTYREHMEKAKPCAHIDCQ